MKGKSWSLVQTKINIFDRKECSEIIVEVVNYFDDRNWKLIEGKIM
jgi:hypothetical protein